MLDTSHKHIRRALPTTRLAISAVSRRRHAASSAQRLSQQRFSALAQSAIRQRPTCARPLLGVKRSQSFGLSGAVISTARDPTGEVYPIYISTRNRTHNPDISAVPFPPNSGVQYRPIVVAARGARLLFVPLHGEGTHGNDRDRCKTRQRPAWRMNYAATARAGGNAENLNVLRVGWSGSASKRRAVATDRPEPCSEILPASTAAARPR